MSDFSFLKNYIFVEGDAEANKEKHAFYPLKKHDIENAELRLGSSFPKELKDFFEQIGYGFICNPNKSGVNRLMDPSSIVDFMLGEGVYEYDPDREIYDTQNYLVFFEVSEGTYLTMDLNNDQHEEGSAIYYFGEKIASSLKDFLVKMDSQTDYFL
ncbi:SMI1/KNR4 family protein [Paenibacillus sambharensis]|uniref:SMI1/KNR4 family protein n=1 Tax=Paenibacillus sambharensis TaxID=1803190 RepID=A0A2W1KZC6_9BACL|nr:SMI1/KNR4 family protein [Paenibacillus sambharensis]PZD93018.1 SMI1/KNR4 family protein [Paenibacillus sambharensis]